MAITWTDDVTSINTCQNKSDWSGSGFSNPDDNNSGSATPIYREGTGCMQASAAKQTEGYWYDTIAVNLTGKALVWWLWTSGPTETQYFTYFSVRMYDGTNWVDYDFIPELTELDRGGWFPAVCWCTASPESHITNSGTPVVSSIDELRLRANQNDSSYDVKLVGWDYIHAISLIGAAGDTVTLEDFAERDATQNFGVVTQVGTTFQAQCSLRYGGTGTTTINESNKTLTFRGANEDHPVGIIINSGGTGSSVTWADMVFNWAFPQDIFTLTGTPTTFKIDGCQFNGGGDCELPAHSGISTRYVKTSKFNDCGEIDIGDITFEDNSISNATSGVLYTGTGTRRSKNNTYQNCTDAIHFDTAQTVTLDGDQFSGNTDDIHFSGTGTLTINPTNGCNVSSSRVSGGGTVVINTPSVLVKQKVTTTTGTAISGARVCLKASDGTGPMPYQESVTSITRVSSVATVTHTAHGMATDDKVDIKGANQIEYRGAHQITVTGTNTYTYTVTGTPATPATGTITATFIAIEGTTDINGEISMTRSFASDQPIAGKAGDATPPPPLYKPGTVTGTIDSTDGYLGSVALVLD